MILIELLVFVLTMISAVFWYKDPSGNYESVTVILGLITTFIDIIRRHNIAKNSANARDIELFETYKEMMLTSGLVSTLEQHDFLLPLHRTTWKSFIQLVENGDDIDHQFSNKKLNKSYLKAYKSAFEFASLISKYTVTMKSPMNDYISIYSVGHKEKPIQESERLQAVEINEAGKEFVKAQKQFVELAIRVLY